MNIVVSVPLDGRLSEMIGKKGSENGITFYNRKVVDDVVVGLAPSNVEEKFYAVAESMLVSGQVLVSTKETGKLFGEVLVACSLLNKRVLFTDDNDITKFLGNLEIKNYEIVERARALESLLKVRGSESGKETRIDIDKAFPVKGLGTVALGIVRGGPVKTHDELYHSSGKLVLVRSMQSQDVDIQEAGPGTRVGLALKNIEFEEIEKGDILTKQKHQKVNAITAKINVSKIANEQVEKGKRYTLVSNFSHAICEVLEVSDNDAKFRLEKSVDLLPGDEMLLIREKIPRIFASGTVL